jgi:NADH:ubiquinone oxidoreductase subunit E
MQPIDNKTVQEIDPEAKRKLGLFRDIQEIINNNNGKSGVPIRVLQQVQEKVGYLPLPVLEIVSKELGLPLSKVYNIITFYHFFTTVPKGKYTIQVCKGTSCYVKGGQRILDYLKKDYNLEPGGITPDGKYSLDMVRCLGCCGLSPVIAVGPDIYRKVKPGEVKSILNNYR